jgi:hypothetical protein
LRLRSLQVEDDEGVGIAEDEFVKAAYDHEHTWKLSSWATSVEMMPWLVGRRGGQ